MFLIRCHESYGCRKGNIKFKFLGLTGYPNFIVLIVLPYTVKRV